MNESGLIGDLRGSINPDDLIKNIDFNDFINDGGDKLIDRIENKDVHFRGTDKVDYKRVEVYPGNKSGELILVFVYEGLGGYEQEDPVRVDLRMIDNLNLMSLIQ